MKTVAGLVAMKRLEKLLVQHVGFHAEIIQPGAVSRLVGLFNIICLLPVCAVTVSNASFEEVNGGTAANWIFMGPDAARAGAWTAEEPFSGKHALRLDAKFGSQS